MKFTTKLTSILCIFSLAAGCQPFNEETRARQAQELADALAAKGFTQGEEVLSANVLNARDFSPLNDQALIVTMGPRESYLFTVLPPCFNLNLALGIAIDSRTSNVRSMDNVVYNPRQGTGRERCPIDKIYKLDALEE